jgi:two-component system sensor histidine kinase ChvG
MKLLLPQWLFERAARTGEKLGNGATGRKMVEKLSSLRDWALQTTRPARRFLARKLAPMRRYIRVNYRFTSLTRRIIVYNMLGLFTLLGGILVLNQYRAGLIEVRVQNLLTQGKIIAEAIANSSSIDRDQVLIDPEEFLEMQSDNDAIGSIEGYDGLDFPINPEKAAPALLSLTAPTGTRARIYDRDGQKLLDSKTLQIQREKLTLPGEENISAVTRLIRWFKRNILRGNIPLYVDIGEANGKAYKEVRAALEGRMESVERINDRSELVVSVAIPIQRMRAVLGVLMLSTRGDDIDKIVYDEIKGILRVGGIALTVMLALSMWLANQIGAPMRKLAAAARRVRQSAKAREEIPDFTNRTDEIGELSLALREMTQALYNRIEAIESFAADVAHELKNPLTSLKSAVETLPLVKKDEQRQRLTNVILHDVKRLDRLISDISDASRLDAELAREEAHSLDLSLLLGNIVPAFNDIKRDIKVDVKLRVEKNWRCPRAFFINGHDTRIGQVINNLVDNAISFSPDGGRVDVIMRRSRNNIEIMVEDEGPGIPPDNLKKIFKRFYTDRPEEQGFGNNSGLGLNISEQIIIAHKGRIWAENRMERGEIKGARFMIELPASEECS